MAYKKSSKAEMDRRIDTVARLLLECHTRSQICRYGQETWGVTVNCVDRYIARARQIIRDDYSTSRQDFIASRLGVIDETIKRAMGTNQLGVVIGALRLQAELTGCTGQNK